MRDAVLEALPGGRSMSDSAPDVASLISATLKGDDAAADRLYSGARPRLLRMALAMGVEPSSADDLVQETLWAAHRNLDRFDPARGSFPGWLGVILVRRVRDAWRGSKRRRRLLAVFGAQVPRQAAPDQRGVDARLTLRRLLATLTDRQREIVALYEIGNLTANEVGRLLDLSAAGVRSVARDARLRLTAAARDAAPPEESKR